MRLVELQQLAPQLHELITRVDLIRLGYLMPGLRSTVEAQAIRLR
jgi:hypothetical protein